MTSPPSAPEHSIYATEIANWTTTAASLFGVQKLFISLYKSIDPPKPAASIMPSFLQPAQAVGPKPPAWFSGLSANKQHGLKVIIYEAIQLMTPYGDMLKSGIALMQQGLPPNVLPPAYKMPPWQLPPKESLLMDVWGGLQPALILLFAKIDTNDSTYLRVVILCILDQINTLATIVIAAIDL